MIAITEPEQIERLFTRKDGTFHFARWGRPIVPVIFGPQDESIPPLKAAIEAVVAMAGHQLAETDPELGTNMMVFFLQDWEELADLRDLDHLIPNLGALVPRLINAKARQYRIFRFDEAGAIRAAFVFLRLTGPMAHRPADEIGLELALKTMLDWGPHAFASHAPLVRGSDGVGRLHPDFAAVARAAYDPVLPPFANNTAHALRIFARLQQENG